MANEIEKTNRSGVLGLMKTICLILLLGSYDTAYAHEAYLVDRNFFREEIGKPFSAHAVESLKNPANLCVAGEITAGILALLSLNFLFRKYGWDKRINRALERLAGVGPLFVRAAIAASFFFSAASWSFLGPELSLRSMPLAPVIRNALFAISFLIAIGLFTEIAALVALFIFSAGFIVFGAYLLTYFNYLGEIIVLFFFGMRKWSFDALFFGPVSLIEKLKKYETTIVRIFYGTALAYAAITVKFLHPDLTVKIVNDWNLTKFHWLFPHDPLLVALGAGISELVIGLFIIFGFEMRLTVFISLIYITMSLVYFRELVWPHLMLYGISLNLIVQPEIFTIDNLLFEKKRRRFRKLPSRSAIDRVE